MARSLRKVRLISRVRRSIACGEKVIIMTKAGFCTVNDRPEEISELGKPFETFGKMLDYDRFQPTLDCASSNSRNPRGGNLALEGMGRA